MPPSSQIWIIVYSNLDDLYFPQARVPVSSLDGEAAVRIEVGAPHDAGRIFGVLSVAVGPEGDRGLAEYRDDAARAGLRILPRDVVTLHRVEISRR